MTGHHFLTQDKQVQKTTFGQGREEVSVVVNAGATTYACTSKLGGEVLLPAYGFLVESPTFVAVHTLKWGGIIYPSPVMFTLRSVAGRPISSGGPMRVFHAFGDESLRIGQTEYTVTREAVVR